MSKLHFGFGFIFGRIYEKWKGQHNTAEKRILVMYMLDTNILIYAIKKNPKKVIDNISKHEPKEICISSITYAELVYGVEKSEAVEKN